VWSGLGHGGHRFQKRRDAERRGFFPPKRGGRKPLCRPGIAGSGETTRHRNMVGRTRVANYIRHSRPPAGPRPSTVWHAQEGNFRNALAERIRGGNKTKGRLIVGFARTVLHCDRAFC